MVEKNQIIEDYIKYNTCLSTSGKSKNSGCYFQPWPNGSNWKWGEP